MMQSKPVSGAVPRSQQETPEPELEHADAEGPETQPNCAEQRPLRLSATKLPEQKQSESLAVEGEGETRRQELLSFCIGNDKEARMKTEHINAFVQDDTPHFGRQSHGLQRDQDRRSSKKIDARGLHLRELRHIPRI